MTLQSSGAISLANVQTEFGGTNPVSFSEYYAGGSYVASGISGVNGAVPSSAAISLSKFYGTSAFFINVSNSSVYCISSSGIIEGSTVTSYVDIKFRANGELYTTAHSDFDPIDLSNSTDSTGNTTLGTYSTTPTLAIKATLITGSVPTGTFGAWQNLTSDVLYTMDTSYYIPPEGGAQYQERTANVKFDIALSSNTSDILKTVYINMQVIATTDGV